MQEASNPTRVKVYGPALERPVKTNQPTYLTVDCSQAGPGAVISAFVFLHVTFGSVRSLPSSRQNQSSEKRLSELSCDVLYSTIVPNHMHTCMSSSYV